MKSKNKAIKLHPRNQHNSDYDFALLCKKLPELSQYVFTNKYATKTLDFSNREAVVALNKALLKTYYTIEHWDIPPGYLCPAIPGRVDYIHYLQDLLQASYQQAKNGHCVNDAPALNKIKVLDIGTGAGCIYPILGRRSYQWQFIASDIDPISIKVATQIIHANKGLSGIQCRLQKTPHHYFQGILKTNERVDITMCNPPFHQSLAEATEGTTRKWQNLAKKPKSQLNFGGQKAELWCEGGELRFISDMIKESQTFKTQVLWFTSLVSKSSHLKALQNTLTQTGVAQNKVIEMRQGQKISRFIAWTFLTCEQQQQWFAHK